MRIGIAATFEYVEQPINWRRADLTQGGNVQQSGKWLNATDAAKYAGVPVAIIKKAIEAGELQTRRLTVSSSRRYIHTTELDGWMARIMASDQI